MRLGLFGSTVLCASSVVSTKLGGFVTTRTDVDYVANIVKDLRDMTENCESGNNMAAETIYMVGKHSPYGDKPGLRSLQNFGKGLSGPNTTYIDPTYAFQMYGLTHGDLSQMQDKSISQFADDYIMRAFKEGKCFHAVEAAKVMILWMQSAHLLWDGLKVCAADSKTNITVDQDKYRVNADNFIAMWMGSLQSSLIIQDGFSLYSMAQKAGLLFGEKHISLANLRIMEAYEDLSAVLSYADACTPVSNTVRKMWVLNNKIVNLMLLPQMQLLIDALYEEDQTAVRLYGSIVVPQLSQCRHSTYAYLKTAIMVNDIDNRDFAKIYNALVSTLECLNINCEELGTYSKDTSVKCDGDGAARLMAEYSPKTSIRQMAKVDMDIHQMKVLMEFDSDTTWDMAMNLYKYGKNSKIVDFEKNAIASSKVGLNNNWNGAADDDDENEDYDYMRPYNPHHDDDGDGNYKHDPDIDDDDNDNDDGDDDNDADDDDDYDDDYDDDDDNDNDDGDDDNDADDDYDDDADDNYDDDGDNLHLDDDTMDDNYDNDGDDDYDDGSGFSFNLDFNSLQTMATSEKRSKVGIYDTFQTYFKNANYADTLIIDTFNGDGYWGTKSKEVRAAVISTTLQTSVMWMAVISEMVDAISDCTSKPADILIESHEWDEVAALIIGSLEGRKTGGSDDIKDGQLLWNLGNRRAIEFGRENKAGYAILNKKMLNLLFSGKGQIETTSCNSLVDTVLKLEHLLLIPVMQSVIEYAMLNEGRSSMNNDKEIAMGVAYANAILPIANSISVPAADVIAKNMLVSGVGTMVPDGSQAVADAISLVAHDIGVGCQFIGKRSGIDACKKLPAVKLSNKSHPVHTNVWIAHIVLVLSSLIIML